MLYSRAIVGALYHAIMLTSKAAPGPAPASEPPLTQRLTRIFSALNAADQHTVLAFADFLAAGGRSAPTPILAPVPAPNRDQNQEPTPLPRPAQETVIAAIRRLTLTYAMLDRDPMLTETASLMTAHVLHGRSARQVIDDLEALFLRHFQDYRAHRAGTLGRG
jgi:hypothetical protein